MAIIQIDPTNPIEPQLDAAQNGDIVELSPGVEIPTKQVLFRVPPAPAPASFTLVVSVNGVEKAREAVSKGDTVAISVE